MCQTISQWTPSKILIQKTISSLEKIYRERNLQFYTDIELEVSTGLDDRDPAAREEDDNFIFNLIVPWQAIWPEITLNVPLSSQEAADRLYNYILRTALPSIEARDFARVGHLYADITLTEAKGYKLEQDTTKAIEITPEKVATLLGMKNLPETSTMYPDVPPIAKTCSTYIEELLTLIDELMNNSTKKDSTDHLAIKLVALLHDYRRIYDVRRVGDCLLSYAEWPEWGLFGKEHHSQMGCLDSVMRELEDLAAERIDKNFEEIETISYVDGLEIKEEDFFDENILTFWTNRITITCPIPFWEHGIGTGLFKDGEDWHEFHPYKPMCYLSHRAFVDGDINFEELKYLNYITWEMLFRHDITVNISDSPKNQE